MSGQIPAGWYHDPYGTPGLQRYWDGAQWTQATQPADEWEDSENSSGSPPQGFAPPSSGPPPQSGTTPPPWTPPVQPNWSSPSGTPQPWEAAKGPTTPPPWTAPPVASRPPGNNTGLLVALVGGGAVVLVLIIAIALFATGAFDSDSEAGPGPSPSRTVASPSVNPAGRSPVTGTITDAQAGVSYVQLGGSWRREIIPSDSSFAQTYGFSQGQIAPVQENYNGQGSQYLSSVYSGRLPSSFTYNGSDDLKTATDTLARQIEAAPEPNGTYPSHTRQDLESDTLTISDRPAYITRFRLSFPQAEANGWNFRSETAVFVMIDQGSGERPSVIFISVPDSHPNGGDLDQIFESVKVL